MADRTQRALAIARRTAHQHAFDRFADGGEVALPEITVRPDDPQLPPEPPPDDQGYWPEPYTMQPGDPYDPLAASAGVAPSGTPSIAQKAVDWWKAQPSWLEQAAAVRKQSDPTRLRPSEAEIDFASGMVGPAATEAVQAAKPFYSAVEQAVTDAKLNAGLPQQWLGPRTERTYMQKDPKTGLDRPATEVKYSGLIGALPGVKPEEIEWLGLPDWLQSLNRPGQNRPPVVTKQDILDHIANNKVDVQEVMKGEPDTKVGNMDDIATRLYGRPYEQLGSRERSHVQSEMFNPSGTPTKFGTYTLPGGENYRELLLTMPTKQLTELPSNYRVVQAAPNWWRVEEPNGRFAVGEGATSEVATANALAVVNKADAAGGNFRSSHWDEPNVLAHVRFDDRVVNGDRTLHMAEIQSDWHQKGRREGYVKDVAQEKQSINDQLNALAAEHQQAIQYRRSGMTDGEIVDKMNGLHDRLRDLNEGVGSVPDAPFKTTWPELALKRMIRYAAENGYDRISWDSGATNAERYDLSKHISSLRFVHNRDMVGELEAHDLNGNRVIRERITDAGKELPDLIGKEAAEKLMAEPANKGNGIRELSGLDLKVGGEGMKGFYDKMLPTVANKLGKKYGARGDAASLPVDKEGWHITPPSQTVHGRWMVKSSDYNSTGLQFDTEAEAQAALASKLKHDTIHTLKLTPELRKAALQQGFPMFARGGKVTASQMARRHAHQDAFDRTFPR